MAEAFERVEKKIDSVDAKVDKIEQTSATKADVAAVDAKVVSVDKDVRILATDVAAMKAIVSQPRPQWTAIVGSIVGLMGVLVSLATLLIVILDH